MKKIFSILILCLLMISLVACSQTKQDKTYSDIPDLYTVTKNNDNTYSYSFKNIDGEVLFSKQNATREPHITQVTPTVYEVSTQAGTGLSTNWAVFCDVKNNKVSETFYYVLGAQGEYVICADYEDNKHFITIQDIFNKSAYYKTYELENVAPVAADFAVKCEFDKDRNTTITYLTGEDYKETKITIDIP